MSLTERFHTGITYALNNAITITMLLTLLYLQLWALIKLSLIIVAHPRSQSRIRAERLPNEFLNVVAPATGDQVDRRDQH